MTFGQDVIGGRKAARCRHMLPLGAFALKPKLYSGRDSWCRPCRAESVRAWRAKRRAAAGVSSRT
jgi:hypothetical protein